MTTAVADYRLSTNVKPTHYDLTIHTDLEAKEFSGFVTAHLDVIRDTTEIVLNTANLELSAGKIFADAFSAKGQALGEPKLDIAQERATYTINAVLPAGSKAQIQIGFKAKLGTNMAGYYLSAWEKDGEKKHYALTQFEPTSARHTFPCWDEPLLKATYTITMVSRVDTVSLSNMPAASETPYTTPDATLSDLFPHISVTDGWKTTRFETTPPVSSYLVAFANGHFEHLESSYKSPLSGKTRTLRIYATSDIIHQAQFALDLKAQVLPLYETVFDVEFPLPKLDTLVATDFDAGAMENWGLITGRTSCLLLDPKKGDIQAKKLVATVQCHEVAHMWFGNITTMAWWDNLYLNEGFATLMGEVIITDKIFPEWKLDSEFITEHLNRALSLDAKLSSHPVEVEVPDANSINQIFDALSYSKAASALRMLSNYVGEEKFLKGVSLYLKDHLYGNTVTKDLWTGIATASGVDVVSLMENWVSKVGFPVLTVIEDSNAIHVRQDRFLETGAAAPQDNETIWTIPLSLLSADNEGQLNIDRSIILSEREKTIPIDTSKPFKLNANTVGVFRVLYTPERLTKIAKEAAKPDSPFSLNDRIGLVHDSFALSKAGLANLSSALTLVEILREEKEYLVWDSVSRKLAELVSIWWEHPEITGGLNAFRQALFGPLVQKLGYENKETDSDDEIQLRTRAISHAAAAKEPSVVAELKSRFDHFIKTGDDSKIPPDLQSAIFIAGMRHGGSREAFEKLKEIYKKPKSPTQSSAAIVAMGSVQDEALLDEVFSFIRTDARDQDVNQFCAAVAANDKSKRPLAKFFLDNYDEIYKRFENLFTLSSLVKTALVQLSTPGDIEKITEFFKDKDVSKFNLSLEQTLDTLRANVAYIDRSSSDLSQWLKKPKN